MCRTKTTTAQDVAARAMDPTFERLMDGYKNLLKVVSVRDLILSSPDKSLPLEHLDNLSQKLHLNKGSLHFIRKYPHIFSFSKPLLNLTDAAIEIHRRESAAIEATAPAVIDRLVRLLSMATATAHSVPLRAVIRIRRELGLPDDFERTIISRNPDFFTLRDNPRERNTHILILNPNPSCFNFTPAVETWREMEFAFKNGYPPGMRVNRGFRAKVKAWQRLPYPGPYEAGRRSRAGIGWMEKRAVGIVHEFLNLTVEKMVEVEKVSHFRECFGIQMNMRDLFLDHPGIFYLSTKGNVHTVFLREAYEKGCLIEPNPVYEARRELLRLVIMGQRGFPNGNAESSCEGVPMEFVAD
ncbi:hypothetical protein QJS04_geneDACA019194 [Acorus gramineus]|uniref:PORR domain-containing protein n=1 Tax=Acorus gramineus TaxID=55184 RepID=A0AAV9BBT4_ACOGR|nr:hypothetical protein QJS04_geneDACA019194 [Acorus gramineus]